MPAEARTPQDDIARARIWYHVAEASSAGESISDISAKNAYVLNAFILDKALKFPFPELKKESDALPLLSAGAMSVEDNPRRGRPRKSDAEKRQTRAARQRRFRNAQKSRLGQSASH